MQLQGIDSYAIIIVNSEVLIIMRDNEVKEKFVCGSSSHATPSLSWSDAECQEAGSVKSPLLPATSLSAWEPAY